MMKFHVSFKIIEEKVNIPKTIINKGSKPWGSSLYRQVSRLNTKEGESHSRSFADAIV